MTHKTNSGAALTSGDVTTATADGIATITFGHPKGNSLPGSLLAKLARQVSAAGADAAARVIVLQSTGTGPFCAGALFDELMAVTDAEQGREFFRGFAHVVLAMIRAPKFIVSRVHGKVAGGGVGLVAASDFSIALDSAASKLSELAVGIGPFVVGPVIERKIGMAAYSAMAVDADWRDAAWCERHGLYSRLCDSPAALDDAVSSLAHTLAASNPAAMAQLKQVFWEGTGEWDLLLAARAETSGTLVLSDFTREAIAKFRNRQARTT
jgi:methylglutaconyl-CoA hydratase